jgi:hypothetical protein
MVLPVDFSAMPSLSVVPPVSIATADMPATAASPGPGHHEANASVEHAPMDVYADTAPTTADVEEEYEEDDEPINEAELEAAALGQIYKEIEGDPPRQICNLCQ